MLPKQPRTSQRLLRPHSRSPITSQARIGDVENYLEQRPIERREAMQSGVGDLADYEIAHSIRGVVGEALHRLHRPFAFRQRPCQMWYQRYADVTFESLTCAKGCRLEITAHHRGTRRDE